MKVAVIVDKANFDRYAPAGHSSWEFIHFRGTGADEVSRLAGSGADAILVDPTIPLPGEIITKMPALKIIHSFGVGYNWIDIGAAAKAGIFVCNNAGVNATAVAEQTILLMLAVLRKYHESEIMVYSARQGEFKIHCLENSLTELGECSVGLVGFGAIGKEVARRLAGFSCSVYYYKPNPIPDPERYNVQYLGKDELLAKCDVISLHLPVKPETENFICDETLGMMKPGAILINTSRGELVDQEAVCRALINGQLGGFGADTLAPEPVLPDNPVINLPEDIRAKVALSPHIGGITTKTFRNSYVKAFKNIEAALNGERPGDIVNGL